MHGPRLWISRAKGSDMTSRGQFIGRQLYQKTEEIPAMSAALWCDKGDHAFSSKDPDKQHFVNTHTVEVPTGNSFGRPTYQERVEVTEEIDICGPCWKSGGILAKKEIPNQPTLDEMEKENEDWQRGYDAAMDQRLGA